MIASPLSLSGKVGGASAPAAEPKDMAELRKAAKAFEAVFIRQILSEMRSSSFGDDLTGSSSVEQFQEMSDARTADTLSERSSFGVADALIRQLAPKHAQAAYAAQDGSAAAAAPAKTGT